jgi:hypothetical protein
MQLNLNEFDSQGNMKGDGDTKKVQLTEAQVKMIIDHASQLIHYYFGSDDALLLNIPDELADRLQELGTVLDETEVLPPGVL